MTRFGRSTAGTASGVRAATGLAACILLAFLMSGTVVTRAYAALDAYEPDDALSQATPITTDGTPRSHTIDPSDDRDCLSVQVVSGHTYAFEASATAPLAVTMTLFRPMGGDTYEYVDASPWGEKSRLVYAATDSETLCLEIDNGDTGVTGSYYVAVSELPPDSYEPDGSAATAKDITVNGVAQSHNILSPSDVDWVRFTGQAGVTCVVETTGDPLLDLTVYAADGSTVLDSVSGGGNDPVRLAFSPPTSGTYYAAVESFRATEYSLSVWSLASDAYEPDGAADPASPITTDRVWQTHTLHTSSDEDWISFPVVTNWAYVVKTLSAGGHEVDTLLTVHDMDDSVIGSDPSARHDYSRVNFTASSDGTCKAVITGAAGDVGDYRVLVEAVPLCEASPSSVDFGDVGVGAGDVETVDLHNPSDSAAAVRLSLEGWDTDDYQILDPITSIPANDTVQVRLRYAPQTAAAGGPDLVTHGEPIQTITDYFGGLPSAIRRTVHVQNNGGAGQAAYTAHVRSLTSSGSLPVLAGDRYAVTCRFPVQSSSFDSIDYSLSLPASFLDAAVFPGLTHTGSPATVTSERERDGGLVVQVHGVDATTSAEIDLLGTSHPGLSAVAVTSASKTLGSWGAAYTFTGRLTAGSSAPLAGKRVALQSSPSSSGFADTQISTTSRADGTFAMTVTPISKTCYRASFAGDAGSQGSRSGYVTVIPLAYVSAPVAPATMSTLRSSKVYGFLKPRHAAGTYPVRIYKYRNVSGKWRGYGYVSARASNYSTYTKYAASMRLAPKGRWRLRACQPSDAGHGVSWSGKYDYVTVR
jgi:hypothetical protein